MLPINLKYLEYLKPEPINQNTLELFEYLDQKKSLSYVHFYPNTEPFELNWGVDSFNIADSTEYKFLPYNSPLPPTQVSTVVPNARSYENLLTDYVLRNWYELEEPEAILEWGGINTIVIRRDGDPILYDQDALDTYILQPVSEALVASNDFEKSYQNELYTVFENTHAKDSSLVIKRARLLTYEGFEILNDIPSDILANTEIIFCDFEKYHTLCANDTTSPILVRDRQPDHLIETYSLTSPELFIYPGESLTDYGLAVTWGVASQQDRVNAEFHNILRAYGLNVWDFNVSDTVAYSDINVDEKKELAILELPDEKCKSECLVYVNLLHSKRGGLIDIDINGSGKVFDTYEESDQFRWEYIATTDADIINIKLIAEAGFQSIGSVAVIPMETYEKIVKSDNRYITIGQYIVSADDTTNCTVVSESYENSILRKFEGRVDCDDNVYGSVKTFPTHGMFVTTDGTLEFNSSNNFLLESGAHNYTIREASIYDLFSLPMVILALNSIVMSTVLIWQRRKN